MTKQKTFGLVLDLPGAPLTDHVVNGVYGVYHPERPTPVGGGLGEVSLDEAKRLGGDPGCPLKLVEIDENEAPDLRAAAAAARRTDKRGAPDDVPSHIGIEGGQ